MIEREQLRALLRDAARDAARVGDGPPRVPRETATAGAPDMADAPAGADERRS